MTYTATINDWLSNWGSGRKAALQRGARQFSTLVSPVSEMESSESVDTTAQPVVKLLITSGLHNGASMDLTADEYRIGSSSDCDIVLRDAEVAANHCLLARKWYGFAMHDLRTGKPQPVAPQSVSYDNGEIDAIFDIGGLLLTLRQAPPAPQTPVSGAQGLERSPSWMLPAVVVVAVVVVAVGFAVANRAAKQASLPHPEQIVAGNQALAAQGFGSVHLRRDTRGELQIIGLVGDNADRQKLAEWLKHSKVGDARVTVQLASELIEQVQHALDTGNLQVSLHDGRLRIEGTTPQLAVRDRIRALTEDLRDTVTVEDRVTYIDSREHAPVGPIPIRVRGVMIGDASYFLTDQGARYFVGGVLPDGAEVLSIDAAKIQFRIAGKIVVYNLE
jgi:hypothetical protein